MISFNKNGYLYINFIFMILQINLPYSEWEYKITAVYKITFDDGSFYIGSSTHLRSRASAWAVFLKTGKGIPKKTIGTKVFNKAAESMSASLDIIELCADADLRYKEAFYLNKYKDDPMMLSTFVSGSWKSVLQHTKKGVFVKKHISMGAAARYNKTTISSIQRVLSGERMACKGMIFSFESDYNKREDGRFIKIVREKKNKRMIAKIDDDGNIIEQFKFKNAAAINVGCSATSVDRVLNGIQKTAGGFFFKFVSP